MDNNSTQVLSNSIIEFCLIPPPYGGVTVYVKRLSDQLRDDGYIVGGYYTSDCNDQRVISSPYYFKEETYNSERNVLCRAVLQFRRMYRNFKQMRPFSIVHYHGLENLKFIWFLYRYCNKKVIITVHSAMIESFYKKTDWLNKHYMKKLAEADVQWIAVSEQAKECMLRLPFTFKYDIPVIAAYVPIKEINPKPLTEHMMEYLKSHTQNIVFYARSFMYNEGVDVYGFDDALKLYADIVNNYNENIGMIFCLSEDKNKNKIELLYSRARELGVYDRIYWQIGAMDNINVLWKNVDVYIRPTSTDGDSVAVREVLAQGTKVVASDVCLRPDGVLTYKFADSKDFMNKTILALKNGRTKPMANYTYYNDMKNIYERMSI